MSEGAVSVTLGINKKDRPFDLKNLDIRMRDPLSAPAVDLDGASG
jgi:hypothetical protein